MNIAVLCGGTSEEREISFASAAMASQALKTKGHDVRVFDLDLNELDSTALIQQYEHPTDNGGPLSPHRSTLESLSKLTGAVDVVFLALHGGTGEDGTIQAALDLAGVAYTGSGHAASAVCMDKDLSKRLLRASGIATPDWCLVKSGDNDFINTLGYPVIVKPNRQGSTIGLSLVGRADELAAAIAFAHRFDDEVLIERFVAGRELSVGVLDGKALSVGEVLIEQNSVFSYGQKYTPGEVREQFPAHIAQDVQEAARRIAEDAHRLLKLRDYSRADFRQDADGTLWCLELNSLPGLTSTSLLPQSADAMGIPFDDLCDTICVLAKRRFVRQAERRHSA